MSGNRDDLFNLLVRCARSTYQVVSKGNHLTVQPHEETLTDLLLMELAADADVDVRRLTKQQEGLLGADWVWWWEGEYDVFGAVVQAKRLLRSAKSSNEIGHYEFDHRVKGDPNRYQADLLMKASRLIGVPPLYALYHGDEISETASSNCTQFPCAVDVLGVAIVPAQVIQANYSRRSSVPFSEMSYWTKPLACQVCPSTCGGLTNPYSALISPSLPPPLLGFDERTRHDDPAYKAALAVAEPLIRLRIGQFFDQGGRRMVSLEPGDPIVELIGSGVRSRQAVPWYVASQANQDDRANDRERMQGDPDISFELTDAPEVSVLFRYSD